MRRHSVSPLGLACIAFAWIGLAVPSASTSAGAVELDEVLAGFDRVQESMRTLSAEFTETTESTLLREPILAQGRLYLTKPDSVRWEYTAPEEMRFVIANDEYTGYFPARKRAERRAVRRWREQLFRILGLGQASSELSKVYDIRLVDPSKGSPDTYQLSLDPRKRKLRKRVESVRFWIDRDSFLPVRVAYEGANGNTREIEFTNLSVNPELAANLYTVDLPPDVEVTRGFSAWSALSEPTEQ